jgi:hypothetical protein
MITQPLAVISVFVQEVLTAPSSKYCSSLAATARAARDNCAACSVLYNAVGWVCGCNGPSVSLYDAPTALDPCDIQTLIEPSSVLSYLLVAAAAAAALCTPSVCKHCMVACCTSAADEDSALFTDAGPVKMSLQVLVDGCFSRTIAAASC